MANPTILDGQQKGTVLTATSLTKGITVDGFTVINGKTSGSGGGINLNSTSTAAQNTLSNNTFSGNTAGTRGGGASLTDGTNTLSNNTFSGNTARYGGGAYLYYGNNTLSNNTFSGNKADYEGGGAYLRAGTNTLSNNTFSGNTAGDGGGGAHLAYGTNTLSNNTFSGNTAGTRGGGAFLVDGTNTLSNNTFSGNTANYGGGAYLLDGTNTLSNNTFSGNTANYGGGGASLNAGTNTLSNNTFSANSATGKGGAISTFNINATLVNNIFWGNKVAGNSTVKNCDISCFFVNNFLAQNNLLQLNSSDYTAANSNELGAGSAGNIFNQDPKFVDAANIAGADGKHRSKDDGLALQSLSPCLNKGISGAGIPAGDILGNARIGVTDIGAYEAIPDPQWDTLYVDQSQTNVVYKGTKWDSAYKTLDEALTIAHNYPVKVIRMAKGTYTPTLVPFGSDAVNESGNLTFHITGGLAVYGGYPAKGGVRDWLKNETKLTNINGRAVLISEPNGSTKEIVIDGFIVELNATGGTTYTVNGNSIGEGGGGIYIYKGVNKLNNIIFSSNQASSYGGALHAEWTNTSISNCYFSDNSATNSFYGTGGAIYSFRSDMTVKNCLFYGNKSLYGGAVYSEKCTNNYVNNTFYGNTSGLMVRTEVNSMYTNNLFANNKNEDFTTLFSVIDGKYRNNAFTAPAPTLGSDTLGNLYGIDPLFVNEANIKGADNRLFTADDGLALQASSPCINKGEGTLAPPFDMIGKIRYLAPDIGAYENSPWGVSVSKPQSESSLSIYPNPTTGIITLSSSTIVEQASITILNGVGQLIFTDKMRNQNSKVLDLTNYAKGVYYITITTDKNTETYKLIKAE